MQRSIGLASLPLAACLWMGQVGTTPAAAQTVTLRTDDGVAIAATYVQAGKGPAPAVVLVHMQTRNRADWESLTDRLADAGIASLAIDLRGHGASGAGPGGAGDLSASALDVKAALAFLRARSETIAGRLGVIGASIGANIALAAAASDPGVRAVVLLSAGIDYRGLRGDAAMRKYGDRPAMLVASLEDPYATRSARELATLGGGLRELRLTSGAGHGTVMLQRQPDLAGAIVDWLKRSLL